jgi:hypothetical protein
VLVSRKRDRSPKINQLLIIRRKVSLPFFLFAIA